MARRVVGVLGGMGPEATILLQQRLLAAVAARDDADHLPLLIDMNPQVPSRIAHLIGGTGTDPTPVLVEMARRLEAAGATALAMPCNTAHHYAVAIQDAVSIQLLNMVELTVSEVARTVPPGTGLGILASPAVRLARVFDAALDRAGLSAVWPQDADAMLAAIREIKAHGPTDAARQALAAAARDVAERGAGVVVVACSEFSLIRDAVPGAIRSLDTVDVLVAAIRDHILHG
ncbi:aspartate/glutamate racemase family protein [Rhodobacter sp. HX-7-19]|uniref:Aspartate/glutamate racemase family protein n=1 Tax=Paragemmobacter kunshanensis TaxID=2583234 RepID=A0A6M1U3G5_9RHOB|nr:amino acid racemase [Rhodobacter kunshanensis]NGQ93272.1 aspartate/glutamate racemase family protein [Rhodobacter kunshanensis]